jgi:hypothetical protein
MSKKSIIHYGILIILLASIIFFSGCQSNKPAAGQLMMDVTGESFPIEKVGLFGKNHNFWIFKIREVTRTGRKSYTIGIKGAERETTLRAFGLQMSDPEGYEWDIVGLSEMTKGRMPGESRREMRVTSYKIGARMDEAATMAIRYLNAIYTPGDPGFDGTLRGTVTKENNEVLYTFESNARLDTYPKPDDGLLVISIYIDGTAVAVVDSRNGYEVTFFEGLQPIQRTQMATTISALFVIMKYGIL